MNILDDPTVSYKAIGLYTQLRETPEDAKITIEYLASKHKDEKWAVHSAVDELVNSGWLRIGLVRKDGKFCGYFWQILTKEVSQ